MNYRPAQLNIIESYKHDSDKIIQGIIEYMLYK